MKKFNWITALILNVVTCGIYGIYLWCVISSNNNKLAEQYGVKKRMHFIVAFLLGIVTCGIVPIVWYFLAGNQQVEIAKACGVKVTPVENGIVWALLMFVPVYSFYVLCTNYNNCVEASGN
ncbi:MAG: DUF4234 domain-containing protein [Clostridia bacterium]|nr:DUF4234 domain-containing protein [Clostridia bacterium]